MGKKAKWLSSLKKALHPDSKEKKSQKEQNLEKQLHLGPSSNADSLEPVDLSPPPQPEEERLIESETVAAATDEVVAPAAPTQAAVVVVRRQLNRGS
ncbi:uncharacterized protein LOC120199142 [Hibiscus syriacus]|uniref:uncharacterized protein LOC120199142 n=1 Tax=Hibiscus syriacus TaxID=106335 RepID=UPI0019247641|nr:uncharacterized protein LOC120199142 [Hibiscus syriacus]